MYSPQYFLEIMSVEGDRIGLQEVIYLWRQYSTIVLIYKQQGGMQVTARGGNWSRLI